jgi:surfactin synthase thioesterase subunit
MLRAEVSQYDPDNDISNVTVFVVSGDKQSVVDALRAWCDRNDEAKKAPTFDGKLIRDFFGMK